MRVFYRSLQTLGLAGLGMSAGFERLHYLLESAFDTDGDLNPAFLKARPAVSLISATIAGMPTPVGRPVFPAQQGTAHTYEMMVH